jgi:hypothetical protein
MSWWSTMAITTPAVSVTKARFMPDRGVVRELSSAARCATSRCCAATGSPRGVSPRAPQKNTPGSINVPVHIGGIVIHPGDIVVGDDDGVVVVPLAMASEILVKAKLRDRKEQEQAGSAPGELPLDPTGATLQLDGMLKGKVIEHREPVSWFPHSPSGSE